VKKKQRSGVIERFFGARKPRDPKPPSTDTSEGGAKATGKKAKDTRGAKAEDANTSAEKIHPSYRDFPDAPWLKGCAIEKELGRGGMGVVYLYRRCSGVNTGQKLAVKTVLPHMLTKQGLATFKREVSINAKLHHENIVHVLDADLSGKHVYVALEYVEGMDLQAFLRQRRRLSIEEAAPLFIGMLEGLAYAHKRDFVHRDLKPANVLLARNGTGWIPKISDFGLSKAFQLAEVTQFTQIGSLFGTPAYWPREQIANYKYLVPASDVFSIAAVFFEMLTGNLIRPFIPMLEMLYQKNQEPEIGHWCAVVYAYEPAALEEASFPKPLCNVINRALRDSEHPHIDKNDPTTIRRFRKQLATQRYPHAGAFRDALVKAFRKMKVAY
jgi:serine/threonine protein kinase